MIPRAVIEEALKQETPFRQRYVLLRFGCGETTSWAAFLAREFEDVGPLTVKEAETVLAGWQ